MCYQSFGIQKNSAEFYYSQSSHFNPTKSNSTSKNTKQIIIITEEQEERSENDSDSSDDHQLAYFNSEINFILSLFFNKHSIKSHLVVNNPILKCSIYLFYRNIRI
jgi:hypothetical protein